MSGLNDSISEVLQKKMTRQQFLSMTGVAFLGLVGILPAIEAVKRSGNTIIDPNAFGSSDFGNVIAHRKHSAASSKKRGP